MKHFKIGLKISFPTINRFVMTGVLVCLLGACTTVKPFVDSRREAGQRDTVGQSTADVVAVCYNKFISDRSQTYDLAEAECQKSRRHAVYESYSSFTCSLIAPYTAFYRCVK